MATVNRPENTPATPPEPGPEPTPDTPTETAVSARPGGSAGAAESAASAGAAEAGPAGAAGSAASAGAAEAGAAGAAAADPATSWDRAITGGVAAFGLMALVVMVVIAQEVIPPLIVLPVLLVAALALRARKRRAGDIVLALLAVVTIVGNLPFLIEDLGHPSSAPAVFATSLFMLAGVLVALTGALCSIFGWAPGAGTTVAAGALVVALLGSLFGFLVGSASESVTVLPSDTVIGAEKVEFSTERVEVATGGAVVVDNADLARHTFTVEDTDINVEVPAKRARRAVIDLPAGEYRFYCEVPGHERMEGTLVVE